MAVYVTGIKQVEANIQKEMMAIRKGTYKGMYAAMKHLEEQMDTVSPMVPEDTRYLRESWYISGDAHRTNPIINAGYTAEYAGVVHEGRINGRPIKNWTKPGSGAKWLQIHFHRNIQEMKLIVAQFVRVPAVGVPGVRTSNYTPISSRTNERNVEF